MNSWWMPGLTDWMKRQWCVNVVTMPLITAIITKNMLLTSVLNGVWLKAWELIRIHHPFENHDQSNCVSHKLDLVIWMIGTNQSSLWFAKIADSFLPMDRNCRFHKLDATNWEPTDKHRPQAEPTVCHMFFGVAGIMFSSSQVPPATGHWALPTSPFGEFQRTPWGARPPGRWRAAIRRATPHQSCLESLCRIVSGEFVSLNHRVNKG